MAITLPAPTRSISEAIASPTGLPTTEANSLSAGGGVNFINNGAVLLRVTVGVTSGITMSVLLQRTIEGFLAGSTLYTTGALPVSLPYLFGPFSPSDLNDVNGKVNLIFSAYTNLAAALYTLPGWVT